MNIEHDFHIHTIYSMDTDKSATVENYVKAAKEIGLKKLGFAEHFWDKNIDGAFEFYKPLYFENILPVKEEINAFKDSGVQLFFGCEVEYNPKISGPAITEETAEKFDFITVPHSHSHETMPMEYIASIEKHTDFLVEVYYNILESNISKYITSMAHPFSIVRAPYSQGELIDKVPDDTLKRMFDKTAKKDIAVEINTGSVLKGFNSPITMENIYESKLMRMFKIAKECGCKFVFGSDSHHSEHLKRALNADAIAEFLGITEDDIKDIAK